MTFLAFVDIETTSLARPFSSTPGEVWEVGLILRGENDLGPFEVERQWFLPVTLEHADPVSLDISRFHERHPDGTDYAYEVTHGKPDAVTPLDRFVDDIVKLTDGAHLVGNVVSFDEERLAAILHRHGRIEMPWHYHLVDVEALVAGWLASEETMLDIARPPWRSEDIARAASVQLPTAEDRHTALGDARWARHLYDAVLGEATP